MTESDLIRLNPTKKNMKMTDKENAEGEKTEDGRWMIEDGQRAKKAETRKAHQAL
jgi:hypothetical protein